MNDVVKESREEGSSDLLLNINKLKVLIVGEEGVLKRLKDILKTAPQTNITVVAQSISADVKHWASSQPNISLQERLYQNDDLQNADVLLVASSQSAFVKKWFNTHVTWD
ncbi:NAD(P)-dependent oxidoreductase [Niabella ginsengisoli]|uniref:Precorrin-2 dehydrogenase n=1 Tax=Niabella ginsengisoli TaxID=522298 RepID=A0ABS9SR59_9BACT|nr:NAD(P)-dependent oxidoreductase [Niabella ginsengisoli]MCH5600830.1 hypothetical protein [Niabella ginsengisoli]